MRRICQVGGFIELLHGRLSHGEGRARPGAGFWRFRWMLLHGIAVPIVPSAQGLAVLVIKEMVIALLAYVCQWYPVIDTMLPVVASVPQCSILREKSTCGTP